MRNPARHLSECQAIGKSLRGRPQDPMKLFVAAWLVLLVAALPIRTKAGDWYPITLSDQQFLSEVVDAVTRRDMAWIADHMSYPVSVTSNGRRRIVKRKKFTAVLQREFTDDVRARLLEAAKQPLFKNWQGVMAGDGILWFSEISVDGGLKHQILALGDFAFQPEESAGPTPPPGEVKRR